MPCCSKLHCRLLFSQNQLNPLDEPGVLEKAATRGFGVREKLSTPVSSNPGSVFHSPNSVSPTPLSSVSPIPRFEDVEKASTPATEVGAGSKVAFEERASLSPVPMVFDDVSASETVRVVKYKLFSTTVLCLKEAHY